MTPLFRFNFEIWPTSTHRKKFQIFKFFVATRNVNFDVENDIEQREPKIID